MAIHNSKKAFVLGLLSLCIALQSQAEDHGFDLINALDFQGFVFGGATYNDLPYRGVEPETTPGLIIIGRMGDVFIEGNRAGYPLARLGFGTLSAIGQIRMHQYLEANDTTLISEDRKRAIEIGPQLSIPLSHGVISQFSLFQDISGAHDSHEFEASLYKRFVFDRARIVATLAAQYQSEDLMNYYVGTDNYQAHSEWTSEAELLATYDMTDDWSAILVWRYYQHGRDFEGSPLTSSDRTQRVALGIGRYF